MKATPKEALIKSVRGEYFPRVPRYVARSAALGTNAKCIEPYPRISRSRSTGNQRFPKEPLKNPVIPDARSASRNPDLLLDSRLRGNDSKGKGALNRQRQLLCLVLFAATLLPAVAVAEETLGRLFYTPEQRLQIDRLKNRPGQAGMTLGNTISINGIVQRRGGGEGSVVWINGVPQSRESADGLLAGRDIAPDAASVKVPGASKVVRLKVGQTLDLNSGAVRNISVAPVAGKDIPTENEQAGQVDSPAQRRVKPAPDGKLE